ncbi:MAG: DUF1329 domain-containing protein, partial [Candidatus Binataceae bacterium]
MSVLKIARGLGFVLFLLVPTIAIAQAGVNTNSAAPSDNSAPATIPAGTTITMQNWRQYQQFMPVGMVKLFEGTYYWKMPQDVQMEVGPTTIYPLPRNYQAATEKYSSQVKVVELPDGGLTLRNYTAGAPFPNPNGPHKGWEILADMWYRYLPHLLVDTYGTGCTEDSYGSINCSADSIVYRQLSFNTDPGIPATVPGGAGKFYTEWVM